METKDKMMCEGCIHLGNDGRCWQDVKHRQYCSKRMTLKQALNPSPDNVEQAAQDYADGVLRRTDPEFAEQKYERREKMRAAMFNGEDLQDAFESGAAWSAHFGAKPDAVEMWAIRRGGALVLCSNEPTRDRDGGYTIRGGVFPLNPDLFPMVGKTPCKITLSLDK